MESKSIRTVPLLAVGTRTLGFAWFFYFVLSFFFVGFPLGITVCLGTLLISLAFPRARGLSDFVLQRSIAVWMAFQPWLALESRAFDDAYDALLRNLGPARKTGVLLVSNHRSHLDMFLVLARVPGLRALAKRGLFAVPVLGRLMWMSRQIPVRRKNLGSFIRAMDTIEERLRRGEIIQVFPEMTRAEAGFPGVAEFSPAPFRVAMKAGAPIFPFVIHGTSAAWPKGSYAIRAGAPVRLEPLAPLFPEEIAGVDGAKALADRVRARIDAAYRRGARA